MMEYRTQTRARNGFAREPFVKGESEWEQFSAGKMKPRSELMYFDGWMSSSSGGAAMRYIDRY